MKYCGAERKNIKTIIDDFTSKFSNNNFNKEGFNLTKTFIDFANVWAKTDDVTKQGIQHAWRFKEALTNDADDILSGITNGRIKSVKELANISDPFIIKGVNESIKSITQSIVKTSSNIKELMDQTKTLEYRQMIRGLQFSSGMIDGFNKFMSGYYFQKWLGFKVKEIDGFILNKDWVFKNNPMMDSFRGDYADGYKKNETSTTDLHMKFDSIVNNEKAISAGLNSNAISMLMKNFDQDIADVNYIKLKNNISELIDKSEVNLRSGLSKDETINFYAETMKGLYSEWKVFNYGTENPPLPEYHLHWDKYRGSYAYHIINSGVDYVKSIYRAYETNEINKVFIDNLSSTEKNMLQLFSKYMFKADDNKLKEFQSFTGLDLENKAFYLRGDYVPYLQNDSTKEIFKVHMEKSIPFADMLSERRSNYENNEVAKNLSQSFITDIESYRAMITSIHESLLTRRMMNYMQTAEYTTWVESHSFENAVFTKYVKGVASGNKKQDIKETSAVVEGFRRLALLTLGMENAVTLLGSGPKNFVQGVSTLSMNKTIFELGDMLYGKLSMKKATLSNEMIGDVGFKDVVPVVDRVMSGLFSGRKAEIQIIDAMRGEEAGNLSKGIQLAFDFIEKSNQYGTLLPFKLLFRKANFGFVKDGPGSILTNVGSEKMLRDWRKHESFSWIGYQFHLDKAYIDAGHDTDGSVKKKWSKNNIENTVRDIVDQYKYDLYEKDNRYFGDFGKDTKPFWTHVMLSKGDTIPKIVLGFMGANWYMFRQAASFGLLTGLQATAKFTGEMAEGLIHGKPTTKAPVAGMCATLAALLIDHYNMLFDDDEQISIPLISAFNQMNDAGLLTRSVALYVAPLFDINLSKEAADNLMSDYARWGGGMLAGRSLESLYEDYKNDLPLFSTLLANANPVNYINNLIDGYVGLLTASTAKQYKKAQDAINAAYQFTFPGFDNILGGNNDLLRMFTSAYGSLKGFSSSAAVSPRNRYYISRFRNQKFQKFLMDVSGFNLLTVHGGMTAFNQKVWVEDMKSSIKGMELENKHRPGTYNEDDINSMKEELRSIGATND